MKAELELMVDRALQDPATGVAAQIAAMSVVPGHSKPPAPAVFLTPTRDDAAVDVKQQLPDWPAVVTGADQAMTLQARVVAGGFRDITIPVVVAYVTGVTGDAAQAYRDCDYALDAILRALDAGLLGNIPKAKKVLNGVRVVSNGDLTIESGLQVTQGGTSYLVAVRIPINARNERTEG